MNNMTVKQLIKKLQKMPQNATILTDDGNGWLESAKKVYYEHFDKDETFGIEEQDAVIITT